MGKRNIVVKQLPSSSDPRQIQLFAAEVEASLAQRRPCLVLDCSHLEEVDESAMHLMLHALEEALKRNGDVKLAAFSPRAETGFAASGLKRLFDVYGTTAEAVASFHKAPARSATEVTAAPLPAVSAA